MPRMQWILVLTVAVAAMTAGPVASADEAPADAPETSDVRLGPRHVDYREGFALRRPSGSERLGGAAANRLAGWRVRDEGTGAVAWQMSVLHADGAANVNLKSYAKLLAARLHQREAFKIDSHKVVKVGDLDAMDLVGVTTGPRRFWQRQVWLQTAPTRFIILKFTGPAGWGEKLATVSDAIVASFERIDPKAALAERRRRLANGRALVATLTDAHMARALRDKPAWFLFRRGDRTVGFTKIAERRARRENVDGMEVRIWSLVNRAEPGKPRRAETARRVLFASADGRNERWSQSASLGTKAAVEEGVKDGHVITCHQSIPDARERTRTRTVPEGNRPIYLTRVAVHLLPRLVDLARPEDMAFAIYNSPANGFDMYSFSVDGAEEIAVGGKKVKAFRCAIQPAADAEPMPLWVDADGHALRLETPDGIIMEAADEDAVRKHFPNADKTVKAMGE